MKMSYTFPVRNYQTEPNKNLSTEANMQSTMMISQLKTKIFDLEQNNKNYENLQNKFKILQNENSLLVQDKPLLAVRLKLSNGHSHKVHCLIRMWQFCFFLQQEANPCQFLKMIRH